jgi:hypothetical protein
MFKKSRAKKKRKFFELQAKNKSLLTEVLYQNSILNETKSGIGNQENHDIVISLTTFDQRIDKVYLVIESLMRQTIKADRIVLWVSKKNGYESLGDLPLTLQRQIDRGLEVRFVDDDIGPYKKIIYSLKEYPDSLILTVDDDILYPIDLVEKLYKNYQAKPNIIYCNRAHTMTVDQSGKIEPYSRWPRPVENFIAGLNVFPTGNSGVLYFPGCFHDDVLNTELFLKLCPDADDIWLKAMSLLRGTECKRVYDKRIESLQFLPVQGLGGGTLKSKNKKRGGNDKKLNAVLNYYQLWDCLH